MDQVRFDPTSLTQAARDTFTVRRVFGEAYERDGVLVVPVARVTGVMGTGAGGGEGEGDAPAWTARRPIGGPHRRTRETSPADAVQSAEPSAQDDATSDGTGRANGRGSGHGGGGGFGTRVRPLGVYVVAPGGVRWRPAVDVDRAITGAQLVAGWVASVALLSWALRQRRR